MRFHPTNDELSNHLGDVFLQRHLPQGTTAQGRKQRDTSQSIPHVTAAIAPNLSSSVEQPELPIVERMDIDDHATSQLAVGHNAFAPRPRSMPTSYELPSYRAPNMFTSKPNSLIQKTLNFARTYLSRYDLIPFTLIVATVIVAAFIGNQQFRIDIPLEPRLQRRFVQVSSLCEETITLLNWDKGYVVNTEQRSLLQEATSRLSGTPTRVKEVTWYSYQKLLPAVQQVVSHPSSCDTITNLVASLNNTSDRIALVLTELQYIVTSIYNNKLALNSLRDQAWQDCETTRKNGKSLWGLQLWFRDSKRDFEMLKVRHDQIIRQINMTAALEKGVEVEFSLWVSFNEDMLRMSNHAMGWVRGDTCQAIAPQSFRAAFLNTVTVILGTVERV